MNELTTTAKKLPQTIEEKTAFVLFGSDALNAYRKKLKAIQSKYGISSEQYKQIQLEAQETAENLLLFSADIGKEMQKIKTAQGFASSIPDVDGKNAETKTQTIHSMGFTDRQARDFQTLAKHPETVQKAIEDARKEDRIVTRQDVLNRIVVPRTNSPRKMIKEMRDNARAEHKDHKENVKQGVVDFGEIVKDKTNQEIIALDTSITISKALSSVTSIGFISSEDLNVMVKNMEPGGKKDMIHRIRESMKILDHLITKIGG